jgi:hypothetical protein
MANEIRMANVEDSPWRDEHWSAATGFNEPPELPPVGQFSLRTLFVTSAVAAVACALLLPIIRRWPNAVQIEFVISITVYFAIVGLAALGFVMSSRRAEKQGGRLLLFLPGRNLRLAVILFVVLTGFGWLNWFLQVDLAVMDDTYTAGAGFKLFVLLHVFNAANFVFAGTRGFQIREHAVVGGAVPIGWRDISRYSWGPNSTLVLFIRSTRTALPIGKVPDNQRAAVEAILDDQVARTRKADAVAV